MGVGQAALVWAQAAPAAPKYLVDHPSQHPALERRGRSLPHYLDPLHRG